MHTGKVSAGKAQYNDAEMDKAKSRDVLFCQGLLLLTVFFFLCPAAQGQPFSFGAADAPDEQISRTWWARSLTVEPRLGASLIGPQWRGVAALTVTASTPHFTARITPTVRGGIYGAYGPDTDEAYDLLRAVRFVRFEPSPRLPLYLRAGPTRRMRLGTGHLVDFFASNAAWDERTIGLEGALATRFATLAGFADDVRLDGVVGGHLALRPLAAMDGRAASVEVGLSAVTDRTLRGGGETDSLTALTGVNADLQLDLLNLGGITLSPFATIAAYANYGRGVGAGLALGSDNFIDLARFRLRLAAFRSSDQFVPGYVGAFYTVSSPRARIVAADEFFEGAPQQPLAGTALQNVEGGSGVLTELRLLVFERVELWSSFYRHYGSQDLSAYHLRLFARGGEGLCLAFGLDRGGLRGLFSLFDRLGDQTLLTFGLDYRLLRPLWLHMDARYSFERLQDAPGGAPRFLPERRFEPTIGLRLTL